ncbi:MAG TPA: HD domain-containing phosphohydrolase [Longimicrobiaceae bacterium]|nr:HD domain-containing phosphohydrolase [Longimicrobiaceae bacterium]
MFHGRVLVVSDRREVVDELDPVIRAEGHLTLTVPHGGEALSVFEQGIIPDLVITDLGGTAPLEGIGYLRRFRQLNQLGQHLVVVEPGAPFTGTTTCGTAGPAFRIEPFSVLPRPLDPEQVRGSIAGAIDRIRQDLQSLRGEMFRETARLQRAIREAQLEMVTALAMTMEAKDPYMRGHCVRVAELCREVARELELDDAAAELVHTAAMLHEIGKLGVSLDLLHKTAPLTPAELEQIRSHTRAGAQIVGAVPSLRRLAPLIEHQYTSYAELPSRIPPDTPEFLLAGILRVVDTYDAMTSDRSYRETLPRELWEKVLRSRAGSEFHPDAVTAFFRVERRIGTAGSRV